MAALEGERAVSRFQPDVILFVGVAGGLKDVRVGDVVAATKVYGYESGKVEQGAFRARPDVARSTYRLEQRARATAQRSDWLQRISGLPHVRTPIVHVGPIASGEKVLASTRYTDWVANVAWSPDGTRIASAGWKTIHVWDATTGTTLVTYIDHTDSIRDITWSPDSQYIASASNDKTVHIWNARTGSRLFIYQKHSDEVASVAWSPDGTRIASACKDGKVHVWQAL